MFIRNLFYLGIALSVVTFGGGGGDKEPSLGFNPSVIPASLFNLNVVTFPGTNIPSVSTGGVRLSAPWYRLEPQKGQWNFSSVDPVVDSMNNRGIPILLMLFSTPRWASARPYEPPVLYHSQGGEQAEAKNIDDWRNYVHTVASHYRGRVRMFELWNEPNEQTYSGTPQSLVDLSAIAYDEIKKVSPQAIVISPPVSRLNAFTKAFFADGGGKKADVIGCHIYVAPNFPEEIPARVAAVRKLLQSVGVNKPIWDTETGWPVRYGPSISPNVQEKFFGKSVSGSTDAAYLARTFILGWWGGLQRIFWFNWDSSEMGMLSGSKSAIAPPAIAYSVLQKWLIGRRIVSCTEKSYMWNCMLNGASGFKGNLLWTEDDFPQKIATPQEAQNGKVHQLDGNVFRAGATLTISGSPILISNE